MSSLLVTGASGFVGRALCARLAKEGREFRVAVRHAVADWPVDQRVLGEMDARTAWQDALQEVDTIIHLAARVHVMNESDTNALLKYREVNVQGTEHLARSAALSGVKRFVFLSSIKVNGESTESAPFTASDVAKPLDPYGVSKWEAEQVLRKVAEETGMEVVIIRPPLVYGEGVKANFLRLMHWADKGIPLPFGAIHNLRSMIYLGNLVDVLMLAIAHPAAAGKVWLVSDGEDISTSELIHRISGAKGRPDRQWQLPPSWLRLAGKLIGKTSEIERLLDSLQVDSTPIRRELGWVPPYTMTQGLSETVRWYRAVHEA